MMSGTITLTMETIGDYTPSMGKNTMRLASPKYKDLMIGDIVQMQYRSVRGGPLIATEILAVRAIAFGTFQDITGMHWEYNMADFLGLSECRQCISDLYPDRVEDEFCAIYFF